MARSSNELDQDSIAEDREFSRKGKALVELLLAS